MNTRLPICLLIALSMLLGVAASPAVAFQSEMAQTSSDNAIEQIANRFLRLYRSVQAAGGIDDTNRAVVTNMLDEVEAMRADNPDNIRLAAVATQLAVLLKDDDRVFELFEQLQRMAPDNEQIAQDWLSYFRTSESPERADDVIERLVDLNLEGPAIRRTLASHLKQSMQYQRAIEYLRSIELDPTNNPDAMVLLAEVLFAEHEFQQASDIMESIPQSVMDLNPTVKNKVGQNAETYKQYIELWQNEQQIRSTEAAADDLPRAELITEHGTIVVELFENEAPNTVANFLTLAEEGFYDGTAFHRVLTNFMAQGGDPLSKEGAEGIAGTGGPGYNIPDEHTRDDHRMHFSGSLSMAKTSAPNTAGSGFYITFEPTPWLNGLHTVFGRVVEGLDIARKIRQDDKLLAVTVLRKRDHEYSVEKLPLPGQTLPKPQPTSTSDEDTDAESTTTGGEDAASNADGEESTSGDD